MKHSTLILMVGTLTLLLSATGYSDSPKVKISNFKTYVSIESVSKDTALEVTIPGGKPQKVTGPKQRFEVPQKAILGDTFSLTLQMDKKGTSIKPCEISVAKIPEYDRRYICSVAGPDKSTLVEVRVFTKLHGSEKSAATANSFVAKSE